MRTSILMVGTFAVASEYRRRRRSTKFLALERLGISLVMAVT